jgi:Ca2+-binding RTX toxin-like protein
MSISTFDLDSIAAGTGATAAFTEQTAVALFPNATLTTAGGSPGRVDSITITLSGATATESLSVAQATLTSLGMTASYSNGVLTLTKSGGTDVDWATALHAVMYNDTSDTPSSATRTITVVATDTSGPTSSTATATINVTAVNDAPVNTVPGAQSATEDTGKVIAGLSISDPDAGSGTMTTTLSVANGTLTVLTVVGGASVSGSGTASVTLTGTLAQINTTLAALNSVTYQGSANFNGSDTLTMTTNDGGNSGSGGAKSDTDTVSITVSAVNDAPVNTVPGAQTATEDTAKVVTGISIADVDAGSGTVTTTLSVAHGTLTVATVGGGAAVSGSGTDTVTLTGTVAQINATLAALNAVTYQGNSNFNGSDTLTVTTNDGGNSGSGGAKSDTDTVSISVSAVNDAPVNTVPGAQTATQDTAKVIAGLAVADVDAGSSSITTTLSVAHGTLTVSTVVGGAAVSGSGTGTVTLTGTVAEINATLAALNAVTYQGDSGFSGSDTLTMTTNDGGNSGSGGAQSDTDTISIEVEAVNHSPTGEVTISGSAVENETLTASNTLADTDGLGAISYQWVRDGTPIDGATGSNYTLTDDDVGATITVVASYTDGHGNDESVSSGATDEVANVNDAPTGTVSISGDAVQGETLSASNTLADEDGLGTISYQWLRDGSPIDGATGSEYTLTEGDVGAAITVVASYTDGHGTAESVSSSATDPVANVNDDPTGTVSISGTATEGETLSASNTLADDDGLGTISYQWLRDGTPIDGATGSDYTLTDADVGAAITVVASYTDGHGTAESVSSSATDPVENVNDDPTGSVSISGDAVQGETLSASNTLADDDGLGTISYQWLRDGTPIDGATGSDYTLTEGDVGAAITVVASYTDGHGTAESVSSDATDAVGNVNDSPTGEVSISGTATQGETLSASNTLADDDGLGSISYQWLRDGTPIDGATDSDYTLTEGDVGTTISVVASYTDGHGTAESVSSSATDPVANVNDDPTGTVSISGTATQGEILSASNTLGDADGLGDISYQWLRDGTPIDGATGTDYTLTEGDVGAAITVVASYTDGHGTAESVSSDATDAVANVNDDPTGSVSISGDAIQGETLSASNTLADDDGLGAISYQWLRDGTPIDGATGSDYTLTEGDVGAAISVVASYTDGHGTPESVSSDATDAVANVNDDPTGSVSISGDAIQGETLSASNTLADDDGLGTISYQWLRDGTPIDGANGTDYTLTEGDVGAAITVVASYTDGHGTAESVYSDATDAVANVNDEPTGTVSISGTALQGETLSASNTLADDDGLGSISYQWLRDGTPIDGATDSDYTLTEGDVGSAISVVASYTDGHGTAESVASSATDPVENVNDDPTGSVSISGTAAQGETLSVSDTLGDPDGPGSISYQWLRDGVAIDGATGTDYTLTESDVGAAISVVASYTDGHGTPESVSSAATDPVENVDDDPTGSVSISGIAVLGEALSASNTLADADGLGAISYQWLRDGVAIDGATGTDYTLTGDDLGAAITVVASYTDGHGTAESVSSDATDPVAEGLVITGTAGDDVLTGTAGNDVIDGLAGIDRMTGGAGNDTYYVDNVKDKVIEGAAGGIDTVRSSVTFTLGNNVENLILTGAAAIDGTGNALDNVITGNGAANTLDGMGGADQMAGGDGDDKYYVDNVGDVVTELAGQGNDTVKSTISYSLGANLENLILIGTSAINGTGNGLDNTITGNDAANVLDGGAGADRMYGGGGDDTYYVDNIGDRAFETSAAGGLDTVISSVSFTLGGNVENLILTGSAVINGTGNALDNVITGNSGANTLDGMGGADQMAGGDGNDTYIVDNVGDVVTELASGGTDTVKSSISYTLGANVENLTLTGTAAINGTGNALDNTITGNDAANILDGGAGADLMTGGGGNDTYYVGTAGDRAIESSTTGGIDTVISSISFSLGNNVENLVLTGTSGLNGTGNALDNVITGNDGANILTGAAGNDTLSGGIGNDTLEGGAGIDSLFGGTGADKFVFRDGDLGTTSATTDWIHDFSHSEGDRIKLTPMDANTANGSGTNEDFTFIGTSGFHNVAGELRYEQVGGNTYVLGDTDGDGTADFMIGIDGLHSLVAGDFIL